MSQATIPSSFVWRRLHSLMGLWLVLFLMEHLFVNSQAALLLGGSAKGFVDAVNTIHNLPYLPAIEIFLLGTPIAIHMVLGVKYLFTSKINSFPSNGSTPSLPKYGRNKAYSWQRITSWILLICIIIHVAKFRFLEYPWSVQENNQTYYAVKLEKDKGLSSAAEKLHVTLYNQNTILEKKDNLELFDALNKQPINDHQLIAVAPNFGAATLLSVREAFQNPWWVALYTIFVLSACFHGFNGFWTFLITWGVILKMSSQKSAVKLALTLMLLVALLGLFSIWGTYFSTLSGT